MKKLFVDDVDSLEVLLAHSMPEGIANLMVPIAVYVAMFFVLCGHQSYNNIASLRNKRNRRSCGSIVGVHDKSMKHAQQAQLWLDDHDRQRMPTGRAKNE